MSKVPKIYYNFVNSNNIIVTSARYSFFRNFSIALNLNPAETGMFDANYRFVGNHRNQWSSITVPYVTFSSSADMKTSIKKSGKDFLFCFAF